MFWGAFEDSGSGPGPEDSAGAISKLGSRRKQIEKAS